ncbi:pentapeptide repeat-containing protein [Aulosira sp. FACHB-615]|uniref:pentapeptide repeat-containing protein n=1 Tax=Aulosira sp. FACHB-615 TaxID=2692777 RepID=UPI001687B910|nr:pentapeptide repeat-containing protein [Aulosira sp. FACHB-615]MBD2488289.1 pentapeptide repeat-containing protein [Aulosira sp. FACHB-615]
MFTYISKFKHPAKNIAVNKNLLIDIFLGIIKRHDKQQHTSQKSCKKSLRVAVEKLHHQILDIRLQGIAELGALANYHKQDNWEIMEFLTAFVRQNSDYKTNQEVKSQSSPKIAPDIQAALQVITTTYTPKSLASEQLDLSYTDLRGANLSGGNLAGVNLYQANLSGVNLAGANLSGAILCAANLSQANLVGANLTEAIISAANLVGANLAQANLVKANFYLANLSETNLQDAILEGANFREAKFSG